jgi:hypothetical protein
MLAAVSITDSLSLPVAQRSFAAMARTVHAAVHLPFTFQAMADDAALAVFASGREPLDGTLEAVEGVRFSGHLHFEGLVVVISAGVAFCHQPRHR